MLGWSGIHKVGIIAFDVIPHRAVSPPRRTHRRVSVVPVKEASDSF